MRFGLSERIIESINHVLGSNSKVDKALIFGSRAKGNYRPASDIDIAIKGQGLNYDDILSLGVKLDDLNLPYKIDLLDYNTIKEPALIEHIDRVGIEFFNRHGDQKLKESEFGLIPENWNFIPAQEFCAKITDGTHDSPKEQKKGKYLITSRHIKGRNIDFENAYLISEDDFDKINIRSKVDQWDVIISMIGEYCGFSYVERNSNIDYAVKNVGLFKTGSRNKAFWLYYYLNSKIGRSILDANKSGTSQPYLTLGFLRELEILIPDDSKVANSIIHILTSLDDKIDLLHRQNKTLEQLAETLFRHWFVEQKTTIGKLGELVETTLGGEWGKENLEADYNLQVQCIRGTDIADNQTGIATRAPIRFIKQKKFEAIEPVEGDLIIEISGGSDDQSTGRTMYINDEVKHLFDYPIVFSNFCRLIRCKKKKYMLYLYCYIQMLYNQGDFFNLENGSSGIRNFNYKAFLFELDYDIHDESSILKFDTDIKPYFLKINRNKHQIKTLTTLRDTLLPKLMSGEVRVKM